MEILTAHLRLDAMRAQDAQAFFAIRGDPEVARYQGWRPATVADAAAFIAKLQNVGVDTPGTWWQRAMRLRDSGELIGALGLHFVDDGCVELGISVAAAQQRRGYARETLEYALDFVFGGLGKHRAIASVDPRNTACIKLMESLGMRREAHFRESVRDGDGWADDMIFALLAREWLATNHRGQSKMA